MLVEAECLRGDQMGMDIRAGHMIYLVEAEGLVVRKNHDGILQYYGGFEYVDKMNRWEMGSWVFYSIEDERVKDCFDTAADIAADAVPARRLFDARP